MLEVYIDGSCRGNGTEKAVGGLGVISYKDGVKYASMQLRLLKPVTNNEAEYAALMYALNLIVGLKDKIIIYSDSKLVVNQVNKKWRIKTEHLRKPCEVCQEGMACFKDITLQWLPRQKNQEANDLAQSITEVSND